jgi:hypothetical protein
VRRQCLRLSISATKAAASPEDDRMLIRAKTVSARMLIRAKTVSSWVPAKFSLYYKMFSGGENVTSGLKFVTDGCLNQFIIYAILIRDLISYDWRKDS